MAAGFGLFVSEEALNVWVRVSKLVFSVTTFLIYFFFFLVSVQGPMYLCDLGLWRTSSSITNHLLWALQVGTSLGRCLTWDQTREVLVSSLSANASYITSTVLWVYWYGPRGPKNNYLPFLWKINSMHCLTEILLFAGTLLMLLLQLLILVGKIGSEVFLWLTSCCMFAGVSVSVTWYHSMLVE